MSGKRYTDEFKAEAAKQVIDQDRSVREVATRLGISIDSLYAWVREQRKLPAARQGDVSLAVENRRLQAELKRVTEARDILKKAAASRAPSPATARASEAVRYRLEPPAARRAPWCAPAANARPTRPPECSPGCAPPAPRGGARRSRPPAGARSSRRARAAANRAAPGN